MDTLLSSPTVSQRLIQTMDVAGLWRTSTSPLAKTENEKMFPRMHGTLLHRSQWLAITGPSVLHGVAALCQTLRAVIEGEQAAGMASNNLSIAMRLIQQTRILQLLVSLLLLRPTSARTARVRASPDPAYERSLLLEAEVSAKEAAGSLLYTLLRPQSMAGGGVYGGMYAVPAAVACHSAAIDPELN